MSKIPTATFFASAKKRHNTMQPSDARSSFGQRNVMLAPFAADRESLTLDRIAPLD
jgi:hypothetical protein